jgi:hypothetical protein
MDGVKDLKALLMTVEIERLLNGEGDGALPLHALYGEVLLEPVPERLKAVLREHCPEDAVAETAISARNPTSAAAS